MDLALILGTSSAPGKSGIKADEKLGKDADLLILRSS
jgi:hypothetical protein